MPITIKDVAACGCIALNGIQNLQRPSIYQPSNERKSEAGHGPVGV